MVMVANVNALSAVTVTDKCNLYVSKLILSVDVPWKKSTVHGV